MKKLPELLIIEKNKLNTSDPWILLLEATLVNPDDDEDISIFRLARNTEDVNYNGQTYTAFPFEIAPLSFTSKGEIPTVTLRIGNITRVIQTEIESYKGAVGSIVKLIVVSAANLAEDHSELEMEFEVMECSADAEWVHFTLGAPNPLRRKFPLERYLPTHCSWKFESKECGYVGEETECNRTFADCVEREREQNFGGFLGLRSGRYQVV